MGKAELPSTFILLPSCRCVSKLCLALPSCHRRILTVATPFRHHLLIHHRPLVVTTPSPTSNSIQHTQSNPHMLSYPSPIENLPPLQPSATHVLGKNCRRVMNEAQAKHPLLINADFLSTTTPRSLHQKKQKKTRNQEVGEQHELPQSSPLPPTPPAPYQKKRRRPSSDSNRQPQS